MLSRLEDEIDLLERHIRILKFVIDNEPIGIIKLSGASKMPQHKIRYSLRVLEQSGMISPSRKGAVTTEKARVFLSELPERFESYSDKIKRL